MALFLQKPVFWNANGYLKPSGAIATSGFPKDRGYGHEEWNNSPRMRFSRKGQGFRVFHTELVGSAPLQENVGQTFVFMTASHDGIQQLVGVAAQAVGMMSEKYKVHRLRICKELKLDALWTDAWDVPLVRSRHDDSVHVFKDHWKRDFHWVPNWLCPEDYFLWLDEPVTLNPLAIMGKSRFLGMFSSYTTLDQQTAARMMDAIPRSQRTETWTRIVDGLFSAPREPVNGSELKEEESLVTDVITQINARRGQGRFRQSLMVEWDRRCAVTGLDCSAVLKASHAKPWAKSNAKERLDTHNGLILSANLDALFDAGLITFEDDGQMRVSALLSAEHRAMLGIPAPLRHRPSEQLSVYLEHHRTEEFLS